MDIEPVDVTPPLAPSGPARRSRGASPRTVSATQPLVSAGAPDRSGSAPGRRDAVIERRGARTDRRAAVAEPDVPGDRPAARGAGELRNQVRELRRRAREVAALAAEPGLGGGELGALVDLAAVADEVQVAMTGLTTTVETELPAQRRGGLPLDDVLALRTRMTGRDRRGLLRTSAGLRRMPGLAGAFEAGLLGAGEVRAVLAAARRLDADGRAELDLGFEDHGWLRRADADTVVDHATTRAARLAARKLDDDRVRAYERRFLAVQPGLDETLAGHFELDRPGGGIVLRALDDAAVPLTGPKDLGRDAALPDHDVEADDRSLGRRRADALVVLAEHWLSGSPSAIPTAAPAAETARAPRGGGGSCVPGREDAAAPPPTAPAAARRARPLVYVWTDIRTLIGADASARAARLLWDTLGPAPVLTATAARRLASDARLQFILADGGEVLGVAAPTAVIPTKVRVAVHARDRGCRFPSCRVPVQQTDLHHVIGRADGGWTVVENLVALCRRHHTAVTEARWRLSMTPNGRVQVRRGRFVASSDPPAAERS